MPNIFKFCLSYTHTHTHTHVYIISINYAVDSNAFMSNFKSTNNKETLYSTAKTSIIGVVKVLVEIG